MAGHTPLPWAYCEDDDAILGPHGVIVAGTGEMHIDRWKADVDLIVRAVNSHDALLKALEGLLGTLEPILEDMPLSAMGAIGKPNLDALGWAVKFGCEAVAAARGRQG